MIDLQHFLDGLENVAVLVLVPFFVAIGACLARVAIGGWQGVRALAANFTIAFVLGMGAHWLMLDMDIGPNTRAAITLCVALISRDLLGTLLSRRTFHALQERIVHEINNRFRHPGTPRHVHPHAGSHQPPQATPDEYAAPRRHCEAGHEPD